MVNWRFVYIDSGAGTHAARLCLAISLVVRVMMVCALREDLLPIAFYLRMHCFAE